MRTRPGLPLPSSEVHIDGWLRNSAQAALAGFVGQMPDLCIEVGGEVFAAGRLGAAAPARNAENVRWWNGESEGNWLAAWLGHVALVGSPADRAAARERVGRILHHQDADGYVGMFADAVRTGRDLITGDLWTQTCVLRALRLWADAEGDDALHRAVDRAVRHTQQRIDVAVAHGGAFQDSRRTGHDLMFVDVLYDAFQRTADPALTATAVALYDAFSDAEIDEPFAHFQRSRLLSDTPLTGHGAHVAEHARVLLELAVMTGDPEGSWLALFERAFAKMAPAIGSSGGIRSDETLGAPGQSPVHLAEAGEEHCALTELADTFLLAATVTGQSVWVDRAEAILVNAAPAGVRADGSAVAYLHAENQSAATRAMGTRWDYSPTHDDAAVCCAPNAGRLLPLVLRRALERMPDGWRLHLYGPMTLTPGGADLTITQRTAYPFGETVEVDVRAPGERFTLELRIPGWCRDASAVPGDVGEATVERRPGSIAVSGVWGATSSVRLHLGQQVQAVPTRDGRVALRLGPLVLAAPIRDRVRPTRRYSGSGLADLDIVADSGLDRQPLVIREARLGEARIDHVPGGSGTWGEPGVTVTVPMMDPSPRATATSGAEDADVRLVPIGATTLRQTVFTVVRPG